MVVGSEVNATASDVLVWADRLAVAAVAVVLVPPLHALERRAA